MAVPILPSQAVRRLAGGYRSATPGSPQLCPRDCREVVGDLTSVDADVLQLPVVKMTLGEPRRPVGGQMKFVGKVIVVRPAARVNDNCFVLSAQLDNGSIPSGEARRNARIFGRIVIVDSSKSSVSGA